MPTSRPTTKPITRNGDSVPTNPNAVGDSEILKWLAKYPLKTIDDSAAGTGRAYPAIAARTNKLKRKPNELIKVHQTQVDQRNMWQWAPQAIHLTDDGI